MDVVICFTPQTLGTVNTEMQGHEELIARNGGGGGGGEGV